MKIFNFVFLVNYSLPQSTTKPWSNNHQPQASANQPFGQPQPQTQDIDGNLSNLVGNLGISNNAQRFPPMQSGGPPIGQPPQQSWNAFQNYNAGPSQQPMGKFILFINLKNNIEV